MQRVTQASVERREDDQRAERTFEDKMSLRWAACRFTDLPRWLQDNDLLQTGHRPALLSYRACLWSIFRLHSETGNIWSHLIGCLLTTYLAIKELVLDEIVMDSTDRDILALFFVAGMLCFAVSSCCHIFACHSLPVFQVLIKADYVCITLYITVSLLTWIYYMFYDSYKAKIYYGSVVLLLAVLTAVACLCDEFSMPHFRRVRAYVFVSFGLFGLIPFIHWSLAESVWTTNELRTIFTYFMIKLSLALSGTLLYANRIPERFFPGACDYWFQSHQLYHVLVVTASLVQCCGIQTIAAYRENTYFYTLSHET